MEYTINNLSKLAGVSTRTLRYYDEIGLLKPKRISTSGYRIYGEDEVNLLQQILFYKELGISLDEIKEIGAIPTFFNDHVRFWGDLHHDEVFGPERAQNISPMGWA